MYTIKFDDCYMTMDNSLDELKEMIVNSQKINEVSIFDEKWNEVFTYRKETNLIEKID